jgi:DNA-binding MarR family transcriptional regulator
MALVLHATKHGGKAHDHSVDESTARDAVNLISWFASQQVTVMDEAAEEKEESLRSKILDVLGHSQGTARDIGRHCNVSADAAKAVIGDLVDEGLVISKPKHGVGRSSIVYLINTSSRLK